MKHIKRLLLLCCVFLLFCQTMPAAAWQYSIDDYIHYTGDRFEERMPGPFTVDQLPWHLIASEDFADNEFESLSTLTSDSWELVDGAIRIEKTQTDKQHEVKFTVKNNDTIEYIEGNYYVFTCKVKTGEDFTGGKARNILSAYSETNKWLTESGTNMLQKADEWTTIYQILELPENTAKLRLSANIEKEATGTVWFDDFAVYRVMADTMRSVLLKPAYKGFLYGDGIGDIDLDVFVNEYSGFYTYDDMILEADLLNEQGTVLKSSVAKTVSQRMNMTFSSKGLPEGKYYLSVRLLSKDGRLLAEQEHIIRKMPADYQPDTYVDENGHLIQNGKKTFQRLAISGPAEEYGTDVYGSIVSRLIDLGIDTANVQVPWWLRDINSTMQTALDRFVEKDKTISLKLSGFIYGPRDAATQRAFLKEPWHGRSLVTLVAADYRERAYTGGYYVFDEANPVTDGAEISWYNDILADIDPDHVTFGTADKRFDEYGMYTSMADMVYIDPYPVWGLETDDISVVGKNMRDIKENFPNRPVGLVLQTFSWADAGRENAVRPPTYEEMRNMLFQALTEGAEHLDCYTLSDMEFGEGWSNTWEERKLEFQSLFAETQTYEDILMSDEPSPRYYLEEASWLNECVRRANGKTYLFAVNNSKSSQQTTVTIPGASACQTAEGSTLAVNDGSVALSFEPLEVKILEFTQEAYASPEAELKQLGFFNCSHVYPVSEGESNTLYITDDSVVINYCADISDGATLYINGVEKNCQGKISVKKATDFTVTVVSADKQTSTTKHYTICRES